MKKIGMFTIMFCYFTVWLILCDLDRKRIEVKKSTVLKKNKFFFKKIIYKVNLSLELKEITLSTLSFFPLFFQK